LTAPVFPPESQTGSSSPRDRCGRPARESFARGCRSCASAGR